MEKIYKAAADALFLVSVVLGSIATAYVGVFLTLFFAERYGMIAFIPIICLFAYVMATLKGDD